MSLLLIVSLSTYGAVGGCGVEEGGGRAKRRPLPPYLPGQGAAPP